MATLTATRGSFVLGAVTRCGARRPGGAVPGSRSVAVGAACCLFARTTRTSKDGPGYIELLVKVAHLEERLATVERERDLFRDLCRDCEAALAEVRKPALLRLLEAIRRR